MNLAIMLSFLAKHHRIPTANPNICSFLSLSEHVCKPPVQNHKGGTQYTLISLFTSHSLCVAPSINMHFYYNNHDKKEAFFAHKVNDKILMTISLSKAQEPEIEITHHSFSRKNKVILTREQCYHLFNLAPQVTAIMHHFEQTAPPTPSTIEISLDAKKLLSITAHPRQPLVRIDTRTKGHYPRRHGFTFNLSEWQSFLTVKKDLDHAICTIKETVSNLQHCKTNRP